MNSLFECCLNLYFLRNLPGLSTDKRNTVDYGVETATYEAPVFWLKVLSKYKLASCL